MTYSEPARTTTRRIRIRRIRVAGLLVVIAAIAAALGYQSPASSSSTAASPIDVPRREHRGALGEADGAVRRRHDGLRRRRSGRRPARLDRQRREGDDAYLVLVTTAAPAGRPGDHAHRRRRRRPTAGVTRSRSCHRAGERADARSALLLRQRASPAARERGLEVRLSSGSRPLGGHPATRLLDDVRGRGRHRADRAARVAVRARRRVRAVPDLRQRRPGTTSCAPSRSTSRLLAFRASPTRATTITGCAGSPATTDRGGSRRRRMVDRVAAVQHGRTTTPTRRTPRMHE